MAALERDVEKAQAEYDELLHALQHKVGRPLRPHELEAHTELMVRQQRHAQSTQARRRGRKLPCTPEEDGAPSACPGPARRSEACGGRDKG